MSKAGFWKKDWFLGLAVSLVLLFAGNSQLIQGLAAAKAKVIGYTVFFSEPQIDPGLTYVNRLLETYHKIVPADASAPPRGVPPEVLEMGATLQEAENALNT